MSGPGELIAAWRRRRREKREKKKVKGPKDHWLREGLETVATAVIMALVVRHFAIEAFKIPTESMSPTLYGDVHGGGAGDRILVNKFPLYFGDPDRWSILVFRFPLDVSQNYVKRCVGLPGETLELRDGDVWVDGSVERKPADVQERMWRSVAPANVPAVRVRYPWVDAEGRPWRESDDVREADGRSRPAVFRLWEAVTDRTVDRDPTMTVGDLRVRCAMELAAGEGSVVLRLVEHDRTYEAVLVEGGGSVVRMEGEEHAVSGLSLERGESHDVSFANVDDAVELVVDGDTVFRREYETDGRPGPSRIANAVEIEVAGMRVLFEDLAVDRDVAYTSFNDTCVTRFHVPPERYVMLGDNSSNSHDGRRWRDGVFVLEDGRRYRFEVHDAPTRHPGAPRRVGSRIRFVDVEGIPRDVAIRELREPRRPDGNGRVIRLADGREYVALVTEIETMGDELRFRDLSGEKHVVAAEELAVPDVGRLDHTPFVHRDQIVGEAFFVFWPVLPPAGFRVRFLGW